MNTQQLVRNIGEILSPIRMYLDRVEEFLLKDVDVEIPLLSEVGQYILKSGGKRVRPALLLFAAGSVGKIDDDTCLTASIIEYIHTATLLHDDVVDNAELRRSKKSARTIWGNEASVLVGDYLFGASFKNLAKLGDIRLVKILSDASTYMARGEIKQLARDNSSTTEKEYLEIIFYKTASLMAAAMQMGAILGGADQTQQDVLYQCGKEIGIAFQLVDDALDYDIKNKELGKQQGTDLKERKMTLPLSHLLEKTSNVEKQEVMNILNGDKITDEHVFFVSELIEQYGSIEYTVQRAKAHISKAKATLQILPQTEYRDGIEHLADFIAYRRN